MSSLVYYLAKNPELQERCRQEVMAALGTKDPNMENMREMPLIQACIREALRINTPIVGCSLSPSPVVVLKLLW